MDVPDRLRGWPLLAATSPTQSIPFSSVVRDLQEMLEENGVRYAIVGGVAVVRLGSARTTGDIDVLLRRDEWRALLAAPSKSPGAFELREDSAAHQPTGTPIDLLFAGDDWELPFLLPDPARVREWDEALGAWFMKPAALLQLKASVYQSKLAEYGAATAAKDLNDVYSLLSARRELRDPELLASLHPHVRQTILQAIEEIEKREERGPKRPK
jgi:hypothetical protein